MKILFAIVICLALCGSISSDLRAEGGLGALAKVGKSQEKMEKILDKETDVFEDISKDIEKGKISQGMATQELIDKYGEPVIKIDDKDTGVSRWVYKPGSATYFDKDKIYIFVDKAVISDIQVIRADATDGSESE